MVLEEVSENVDLSPVKPEQIDLSPKVSSLADVRKRVFSYMASNNKLSRISMVMEAIKAMGTEERGASIPAIIKWIIGNYAVQDINKLKIQIKKAILKCLDDGKIERSRTSKGAQGFSGSFVLKQKINFSSSKENSKQRKTKPRMKK